MCEYEQPASRWTIVAVGFSLPVVVALVGAGLTVAGVELSGGRVTGLVIVTLIGLPLAVAGAVEALPRSFRLWERVGLASVFVPPLFAATVYVALTVYAIAYCVTGSYNL